MFGFGELAEIFDLALKGFRLVKLIGCGQQSDVSAGQSLTSNGVFSHSRVGIRMLPEATIHIILRFAFFIDYLMECRV